MNWILGLVGAFFGMAISQSSWLLGAIGGFLVMFLFGSLAKLRRRIEAVERELTSTRAEFATRLASEETSRLRARISAATSASASAGTAVPPEPTPTPVVLQETVAPAPRSSDQRAPEPAAEPVEDVPRYRVEPKPVPATPPIEQAPQALHQPDWAEKAVARIKGWFTEGNVPVKVGVLVLFAGIAAALRYAVAQGYFHMPIEVRLALIAAGGVAGLLFGWKERVKRPAFALSLQGGAIGVLLMTVFAAYKLYALLPPTAAFALVVVLVAGSALLAVLQDAIALAALGFLGGYLAPVLISTGSHDHVALFAYYAVLNAAVFGVSWKRSWRLLNLIGFAFTFGVGTAWGTQFYRPELFATVEPFLILFFVFYVVIGLLYVIRQTEHRRPWVDGTLVFGTPLLAFPLQAGLLKDDRMGLAFSALAVAVVYFGLVYWLRRRRDERLLTDAYAALALTFATLAVPLALSSGTTASVWALEGAGIAWLGIRQDRKFPWIAGLVLQLLAAGSYLIGEFDRPGLDAQTSLLLLNPAWLGAALIALSGYVLNFVHDRLRPIRILPGLLFVWATIWWLAAAGTQLELAAALRVGDWRFSMGYLAATILLASILRSRLPWPRMGRLVALCAALALPMVFGYDHQGGGPLAPLMLGSWAAFVVAVGWALRSTREESSGSMAITHAVSLWTLALAASVQADHMADVWKLANGWDVALTLAPLVLTTFLLWRRPEVFAWPRAARFADYRIGWFAPAAVLLGLAFLFGLFAEGTTAPVGYVPLLNPLELSLVAALALLYGLCEGQFEALRKFWPYAGFALVTSATLRAVHQWHGEPWSGQIFDSGVSQMALTLVWSLLGVSFWIIGSRRGNRRLWMGGAVLMGVVLLKLIALDRHYMGDIPGIASFVVVGLLMMGVGYIAPSPPKEEPDGMPNDDKVETA